MVVLGEGEEVTFGLVAGVGVSLGRAARAVGVRSMRVEIPEKGIKRLRLGRDGAAGSRGPADY